MGRQDRELHSLLTDLAQVEPGRGFHFSEHVFPSIKTFDSELTSGRVLVRPRALLGGVSDAVGDFERVVGRLVGRLDLPRRTRKRLPTLVHF